MAFARKDLHKDEWFGCTMRTDDWSVDWEIQELLIFIRHMNIFSLAVHTIRFDI
jgi:hypothetical protein